MADDFTDGSSTATVNLSASVNVTKMGLQKGTDRTVYVEWQWSGVTGTKEYRVIWYSLAMILLRLDCRVHIPHHQMRLW